LLFVVSTFLKGVAMSNVFVALRPGRTRPKLKLVPASEPDASFLQDAASGIEASEAAAAIGLDPAKPQLTLWRAKTAPISGTEVSPETQTWTETSAQYWRALLEPLVASVYTKRSGNTLRRVNLLTRHPAHPWMQARVDWEVLGCPEVDLMRYVSVGRQDAAAWEEGCPRMSGSTPCICLWSPVSRRLTWLSWCAAKSCRSIGWCVMNP
jgi:hypothetical protein